MILKKAEQYLTRYFEEHLVWSDFWIPQPGFSDEWVTACVGQCLLDSGIELEKNTKEALKNGVEFLKKARHLDGGFGFNRFCRSDCDSSVQVLLFFQKMGLPLQEEDFQYIQKYLRKDGGFATYLDGPSAAWKISHLDVTGWAHLLLADYKEYQSFDSLQTKKYMEQWLQDDFLPPSYWWESKYYAALMLFLCFERYQYEFPKKQVLERCLREEIPDSILETTWLLALLLHLGGKKEDTEPLFTHILNAQNEDGSFPGSKILRVTKADCFEPFLEKKNYSLVKENGVFTTAWVLKTIGKYRVL